MGFKRDTYVQLHAGHHQRVLDACKLAQPGGRQWVTLKEVEAWSGGYPAAGAIMALREQGKVETRIGPNGRVEIAARGVAA